MKNFLNADGTLAIVDEITRLNAQVATLDTSIATASQKISAAMQEVARVSKLPKNPTVLQRLSELNQMINLKKQNVNELITQRTALVAAIEKKRTELANANVLPPPAPEPLPDTKLLDMPTGDTNIFGIGQNGAPHNYGIMALWGLGASALIYGVVKLIRRKN